jgi:hypothetical protein
VHHLSFQRWGVAINNMIVYPKRVPHVGSKQTQTECWDGYTQIGADYATADLQIDR